MSAIDNYYELLKERNALRTRIQSLEATIEACKVALDHCKTDNHADNNRGRCQCHGHECRVCDVIDSTLATIHESQHKGVKA